MSECVSQTVSRGRVVWPSLWTVTLWGGSSVCVSLRWWCFWSPGLGVRICVPGEMVCVRACVRIHACLNLWLWLCVSAWSGCAQWLCGCVCVYMYEAEEPVCVCVCQLVVLSVVSVWGGYVRMPGLYMRLGWLCVSVCGSEGGCQFVVVVSV